MSRNDIGVEFQILEERKKGFFSHIVGVGVYVLKMAIWSYLEIGKSVRRCLTHWMQVMVSII